MKNTTLFPLAFAVLLFSAGFSNAQNYDVVCNGGKEFSFSKDTVAQLTLFTGRYMEGKTYIHWNVACQQADGLYIIYSSRDGKDYGVVGYKRGIGVPISIPIAYYFHDEHPLEGTTYYKVIHFSMNKTYLISEKIAVTFEGVILSNAQ
jgi:hypothetical protein